MSKKQEINTPETDSGDETPTIHLHIDEADMARRMSANGNQYATAVVEVIDPLSYDGKDRRSKITTIIPSGGLQTSHGTIYLSKPTRTETGSGKKLRAMISFTPRESVFDISNANSGTNLFRGFFTLFWISMFLFAVRTYVRSVEAYGYPLSMEFGMRYMFTDDTIMLFISDGILVLSTAICVPFAKAIQKGWISYYGTGVILQHLWQTAVLFTAIKWTFTRHWPWVQSGYLTLHTLVMIMKMHSYMNINGYLAHVDAQAKSILTQLHKLTDSFGGWDAAVALAESRRRALDASSEDEAPTNDTPTPSSTNNESTLRKRSKSASTRSPQLQPANTVNASQIITTGNHVLPASHVLKPGPHPLVYHPDETVSSLAKDYSELESELVGMGPEYIRWPDNITYKRFAYYMLVPTLVYELEYPMTDKIRPLYVLEKTIATFGTFVLLYTVTESFIFPLTPTPDQSFLRSLLDLALPFMIAYLLLFYLIFECICNGFAELTRFADRQFYEDWWNSTSWDEFSRKWNKPVHTFLLRHVYATSITSYKLSKKSAMFLTFLLSAAVHELVMAIVTKKIRMYLFTLQLAQIPLIAIGRIPAIKKNRLLGNIVFWIGLYAGFPLLCVAYCAY
ncbi:MBOAT, membrane-bound O-acyltransferase family-domain-containing protein [Irpex rosettiformis]|uniref:MBOAT, membrane-bound O-acyltransferase family-domain-containing protein n=1 Tax=Irpex rosettiformis TaxID=378272 RepID=A0ACB8TPI5_9APHY|nr:MBOAT, membrane-bound O-acyltransferase family-domain-containing protein [Irpex rosettiformis]